MSEEEKSLEQFDQNQAEQSSIKNQTSLGRFPPLWEVRSLGAEFSIESGREKPKRNFRSDGHPVYGANGIIGSADEYMFDDPVITISCRGTCGKIYLTKSQSWVTNNSLVLTNGRKENKRFLLDALRYHSVERAISGSAQPQITATMLSKMDYISPPLPEQRKIASVLYTVDQAIQKTKKIESQHQRIQQGLLQNFLTEGIRETELFETDTKLGELPSHWDIVAIEEILSDEENAFTDGARYSLSSAEIHDEGKVRAILLEEVGEGEFNDSNPKFATHEKYEEITHRAIYPGEVVVAKMAEPVARACIVPETYNKYLLGCADVVRIVPNEEINERFLMYCMNSHKLWRQAVAHVRGTGRSRINLENIAELRLPKPPLSEQREIVDVLHEFDRKIEYERNYRNQLERLKQGLMQDLLSGEVRTQHKDIEVVEDVLQHG